MSARRLSLGQLRGGHCHAGWHVLVEGVLAAQGVERAVGCLLAAHEHGSKGGAHARTAVQLSHLSASTSCVRATSAARISAKKMLASAVNAAQLL